MPPAEATASFTFAEIRDFMRGEVKEAVKDAVGGVADQVAGNTKDIKELKEAICELKNTVASGGSQQGNESSSSMVPTNEESRENASFRIKKLLLGEEKYQLSLIHI